MAAPDQVLPETSVTELPPGPGFGATGIADVAVFCGPAARGPLTPSPFGAQDIAGVVAMYGTGPTVKECVYAISKVARDFVFLRFSTATVAASHDAAAVAVFAVGGATSTLSGTALDGADVLITFTLGGVTGTGPITYTVSYTGNVADAGAPISLGTALVIVVLGVTVTLGSGHTITAGDTISWHQMPASSTVLPTVFTGTGTSVITVTGTPLDAYEVAFRCIFGGTIGAASPAISYQYTLDYGAPDPVWTAVTLLSTANTLLLLDGPISTESTGLTLNFAAGTLVAGDLFTFNTTAPAYDGAGATAALTGTSPTTGLINYKGAWTWTRLVGPVSESTAATVAGIVGAWAGGKQKFSWGVVDARDRGTYESLSAWRGRLVTEWTPYLSTYVAADAGMARVTCPINGRNNRRPTMTAIMPRAMGIPIQLDWGEFDLLALPTDVSIVNASQVPVEHDANIDPALNAMGFVTLRHWPGEIGVYPTKAPLMGGTGDIKRIPLRRVKNVSDIILARSIRSEAVKAFLANPIGVKGTGADGLPLKAGDLPPADLAKITRLCQTDQNAGIVSTKMATAVTITVDKTPINFGGGSYGLSVASKIQPLKYVDKIDATSQFVTA